MGTMLAPTEPTGEGKARIVLISPPWHLANRPSLALGVLKAYARNRGAEVSACHLHLRVACALGWHRYSEIAMHWELGEALYAALVSPAEADSILGGVARRLRESGRPELAEYATLEFCRRIGTLTAVAVAECGLAAYGMLGFSVSHLQLMASLYIARMLKRQAPGALVVFGGSGISGEAGRSLLERAPEIDAVVDGEGEEALLAIANLPAPCTPADLRLVPNLWFRAGQGCVEHSAPSLLRDLDQTAAPDCDDYFDTAERNQLPRSALVLPMEASRGCAWEHRRGHGTRFGCAFCSLNLNWPNHRPKSPRRVAGEVAEAVRRYRVMNVSFADAYLPEPQRKELLRELAAMGLDLTLFCELRADFDEETARLLALAGARKVQIGVESFSTAMLNRLGKGVTALSNVQAIKLCQEHGIPYQYNLLTGVPGTGRNEIEETLRVLPLLRGFEPPHLVPLYVGRGSRMHRNPAAFGIEAASLDREPCAYLPSFLADAGVTGEVPHQCLSGALPDSEWQRIADEVEGWVQARQRAGAAPLLTYQDGGGFIVIDDSRTDPARSFTLGESERDVFLAAGRATSAGRLRQLCAGMDGGKFTRIVEWLEAEGLLLGEGSRLLALPVRKPLPCGIPRGTNYADLRTVSFHQ